MSRAVQLADDAVALVVDPDSALIIILPDRFHHQYGEQQMVADLRDALDKVGLEGRSLIIVGDVQMAVIRGVYEGCPEHGAIPCPVCEPDGAEDACGPDARGDG